MAKLSLWKPRKGNDFKFIDTISREQFYVASLGIFIHLYEGVIDQGDPTDPSQPSEDQVDNWGITTIQDLTFLENRNRKYSDDVFELRGHFNEADKDFELLQFNLALANGSKFVTFHLNDMLDKLGRKLMSGDVIEMPNLRDDALLDESLKAINQWYVITDASWPTDGFSPTWFPHFWRVKAEPIKDAPEFYDITRNEENEPDPLIEILSMAARNIAANDAVVAKAEQDVPERNFETRHFYVVDGDELAGQYPWVWAGDGIPPNNSSLATSGTAFPSTPAEAEYFLRTDYEPSRLFQFQSGTWRFKEIDLRKTWEKTNRTLETFINNDNTFTEKDAIVPEKQPITKAVKPRIDF